jgi:hypothetical protein
MPVQPVEYHPFQYPRKYRPLGYGSWEPPTPPPEPTTGPGRRRTVILILAALLATIVIHVGIAVADDGGGSSNAPTAASPDVTDPAQDPCAEGEDPFIGPDFDDVGDPGTGSDPGAAGPNDDLRQRL